MDSRRCWLVKPSAIRNRKWASIDDDGEWRGKLFKLLLHPSQSRCTIVRRVFSKPSNCQSRDRINQMQQLHETTVHLRCFWVPRFSTPLYRIIMLFFSTVNEQVALRPSSLEMDLSSVSLDIPFIKGSHLRFQTSPVIHGNRTRIKARLASRNRFQTLSTYGTERPAWSE